MPEQNYIQQFNRFAKEGPSLIRKALTTATGVGAALIPQNLEEIITDTVIRLSPEIAMLATKKIKGKTHEFDRLIARPSRGGAMGENATTPVTNSKTVRDDVTLKIVRRKGKVTNFMLDTSQEFIDAAAYEMENHIQAHVLDLIYYAIWGNTVANSYEISGLEQFISSNRKDFSNIGAGAVAGGRVPTTLAFLDKLIDASNRKGGVKHKRAFLMSPEMLSKVSSLLANVRLNQGLLGSGITQVDIGGGWRLNAYRDIPIIETTSLTPIEAMSPTITLTGVNTGGGLSDDTYYLYIAPITYEGEQLSGEGGVQGVEKTITLSGGGAVQRIQIDFNDVHKSNINGTLEESALGYKIYLGTTTGAANCTLVKQVGAFTYDAEGSPSGDNGVDTSIFVDSVSAETNVPAHMRTDIPLVGGGVNDAFSPESVVFWDMDPIQGLGKVPFTNTAGDRYEGLITTKRLAETDDFINFLVKTYFALTPSFEATSSWTRGIRIE